ncbi:DUF87 domain-containing protein, partial [Candidatus Pacearchaeota archaeon]|nr:DUF87 domain-containing protein [Candidatus Pacearchaeota archaeon]MBD3283732.1 DUF87 domain-containing protein [Candidatus Pacearchaeota archaeon]
MNQKKRADLVWTIVKRELKKEKKEKFVLFSFLFLVLISLSVLLVFLTSKLLLTGYAPYIDSQAGYVTEINITEYFEVIYWTGIYGLALRVPGYTAQIDEDLDPGEVVEVPLYFDCIQEDAIGGPEIYASTSQTVDFNSLQPATHQMIDDFTGCSGSGECSADTYIENLSVMVGATNITDVPGTYTLKYTGENDIFDIGALNDSNNLVFFAHLKTIQKGYSSNATVNYQMILPIPENTTQKYYFFTDPFDECPAGGVGNNINASSWGYVKDTSGNPIGNATVSVAGSYDTTDSSGFFNVTFTVAPGTYNLVGMKSGYIPNFTDVVITFSEPHYHANLTLDVYSYYNVTINPYVYGYVFNEVGYPMGNVSVYLGDDTDISDSSGFYELNPFLFPGQSPIVAIKTDYDNYYYILNFTNTTSSLNHNITMEPVTVVYEYPTGPYTTGPYERPPGVRQRQVIEMERKKGEDYWVSTKEIRKQVRQNTFVEEAVGIYNFKRSSISLSFSLSRNLEDFVKLDKTSSVLNADSFDEVILTIYGTKPVGTYNGTLTISGDIEKTIPVIIEVVEKRFLVETLLMAIDLFRTVVAPGDILKYKLNLQNLLREQGYKVSLQMMVKEANGSTVYASDTDEVEILNSVTLLKEIKIPKNASEGDYHLVVHADYLNFYSSAVSPFVVSKPIYLYTILGIPLWIYLVIISFFSFLFLNFFIYKSYKERKKRYRIALDLGTLPKPGDRIVRLGNIAETKTPAYYGLDKLTTHCIVAGATGMGKSISAQVIIEEALMNNIAVIVFDPTAQWSGMLRKCTDKKMMSYYPKFGMKEADVRAFKGNVRQVKNARQIIDISKHTNPGQIQIFTLNKLDPKDIDVFVANVIRQIFRSDPKESPNLKLIIVFDEVHRLLSKFGGSGEGFLQVERACREFRKWGMGVMLISQVLSDFVGEIKANINTEVQTRTLEESDLSRIKTKYGDEFLKSLVRAEVGVAMFQNAEYNRGRPYFVNFRPILHNTRRLSDEELEKYNKYNDIVDDLEYQLEQLEKEKVD